MTDLFLLPDKPVSAMNQEELLTMKSYYESQIAALDQQEPTDEMSEEYESWAEEHEDLEDSLDEILDLLES